MALGYKRAISQPLVIENGKANTLSCGPPLQIKVTAKPEEKTETVTIRDSSGTMRRDTRVAPNASTDLRINAVATGAGGEIYSSYRKGKNAQELPPKPSFTIVDSRGKLLASGNLEFG